MTKQRNVHVPVKLNRNFLNFPLARDQRTKAEWFQDSKTGNWAADLPGEGRDIRRIRLMLPATASAPMRRCPSALDINVLFQLLAEVQRKGATRQIEFSSLAALLRRVGLPARDRERARVEASVMHWTRLSISYQHWYRNGGHAARSLPPPVEDAVRDGNQIKITLDRDWYNLAREKAYYEWVPLPLPRQAAVQNIVLNILTQDAAQAHDPELALDGYFERAAPVTKAMDRCWLARKIGLLHKNRNSVLDRAVDKSAEWFAANGGRLEVVAASPDEERIAFRYAKPRLPRWDLISSMGRSCGPPQTRRPPIDRSLGLRLGDVAISGVAVPDQDDTLAQYLALVDREAGSEE